MNVLTINLPDTVDFDLKEAKMILATQLFEKGKLSLGQAANLVGYSKRAFMEILESYGISMFNYSAKDLDEDISNAQNYNL